MGEPRSTVGEDEFRVRDAMARYAKDVHGGGWNCSCKVVVQGLRRSGPVRLAVEGAEDAPLWFLWR